MKNNPKHRTNAFSCWLFVIAILSCADEGIVPRMEGDIIGRVSIVVDEFGTPMEDRSGYKITFEGAVPAVSVITDSHGMFHIEDLAAGTYNILFERPGFQTRKEFSYKFVGGNVPTYYDAPYLSQLSSTSIMTFDATVTEEDNPDPSKYTMVELKWVIIPEETLNERRELETYLGFSADVSSEKYEFRLQGPGIIRLDKIQSGTKLYAIAYPKPASCNMWYNFEKQTFSDTCLGEPSDVIELIVP